MIFSPHFLSLDKLLDLAPMSASGKQFIVLLILAYGAAALLLESGVHFRDLRQVQRTSTRQQNQIDQQSKMRIKLIKEI